MTNTGSYHYDWIKDVSMKNTSPFTQPYLAYKLDTTQQNTVSLCWAGDEPFWYHTWVWTPQEGTDQISLKCLWFVTAVAWWTVVIWDQLTTWANWKLVVATSWDTVYAQSLSEADTDEHIQAKIVAPFTV